MVPVYGFGGCLWWQVFVCNSTPQIRTQEPWKGCSGLVQTGPGALRQPQGKTGLERGALALCQAAGQSYLRFWVSRVALGSLRRIYFGLRCVALQGDGDRRGLSEIFLMNLYLLPIIYLFHPSYLCMYSLTFFSAYDTAHANYAKSPSYTAPQVSY